MRKIMAVTSAVWVLGTVASSAATAEKVTGRLIGPLDSVIADRILGQVEVVPFSQTHDSPILLQGKTIFGLEDTQAQEVLATYQAGHTIALLDAAMAHVKALHGIIGTGVNYRSKNAGVVMAYALRQENHIPTATLLTYVDRSPLRTPSGDPGPQGLLDEDLALTRAVHRLLIELSHTPLSTPALPPDSTPALPPPIAWQDNPLQIHTFAINAPGGVYNTAINVYALHRCLDNTDHYVVTAQADWTATNAIWQSASTNFDTPGTAPTLWCNEPQSEWPCPADELVIQWQDTRDYCSSAGFSGNDSDVCRYINYPLSYDLQMVPPSDGTVTQIEASPPATQGQTKTYSSGFSFQIGDTVNVSANGPAGGLAAGATWSNIVQTQVPPLDVEVSNTGNEGVDWTFKYCTSGLEPDPGTNCTGHVQMVSDVCKAQLGDDSGTNPQQGQTPTGKFSNAIQTAHWQASPNTRVGSTFDIEVAFTANIGYTIAHLGTDATNSSGRINPDPDVGCNVFGCECSSETWVTPLTKSYVFEIPFPSTTCSTTQ